MRNWESRGSEFCWVSSWLFVLFFSLGAGGVDLLVRWEAMQNAIDVIIPPLSSLLSSHFQVYPL